MTTTKKSIRLGKENRYELFILFGNFKAYSARQIFEKLPSGYASLRTVQNWKTRYNRAVRKALILSRDW
jgi:hypothetical protein